MTVQARQQFHGIAIHVIQIRAIQDLFEFGVMDYLGSAVHAGLADIMDAIAPLNPVVDDPQDIWNLDRVQAHA